MSDKESSPNLWLPIDYWNLNEVFTTESISPISFYSLRGFGNPVNRIHGRFEDINYLVLFQDKFDSDVTIEICSELLDESFLQRTKSGYSEYYKTIYLRKGLFKVHFTERRKMQEYINQQFMLLEVKAVNKYQLDHFVVADLESRRVSEVSYQPKFFTDYSEKEPYFDRAYNQVKGMIYGYVIGNLGSLGTDEQGLISDLTKLKNLIGSAHTDLALTEHYSNYWLINVKKQVKDCSSKYFELFHQNSDVFDRLILRLVEVDNLNKMRCEEIEKHKSPEYAFNFEKAQEELEQARQKVFEYESQHNINSLKSELERIKQEEKRRGEAKGKAREYYKKGSVEHTRKTQIKNRIEEFEKSNPQYEYLLSNVSFSKNRVSSYQSNGTQFDTSIKEQFNRISDQLNDVLKRTKRFFLNINNEDSELPDISFTIDLDVLTHHYYRSQKIYKDFSIELPHSLSDEISDQEKELLKISLNAILSFPQGRLGTYSEEGVLQIIAEIGKHLADGDAKNTLRDYYAYRTAKKDNFVFPKSDTLASIVVFLMKVQGHDQINKMLIAKGVQHKNIAFMLYGAYIGFANLPKTFTNLIFDSSNKTLQDYLDNYLFDCYLKTGSIKH